MGQINEPYSDQEVICICLFIYNQNVFFLDRCAAITDFGINYLTNLNYLRVLCLRFCTSLSDTSLIHILNIISLRSLSLAGEFPFNASNPKYFLLYTLTFERSLVSCFISFSISCLHSYFLLCLLCLLSSFAILDSWRGEPTESRISTFIILIPTPLCYSKASLMSEFRPV